MESIGRLAGGVAHDFNNMLTVIQGYSQLGLMESEPTSHIHGFLQEIDHTATRSAELTKQLLAFARKQTIAPKVLDLNETVSGMLKMLQRLMGEDISLAWHPAPGLWQIKTDPSQIDQILANLCVNARDAIKGTGHVTIKTSNNTIDADFCKKYPDTHPGEYVHLSVSDDGSGMDKETMDHVFEPFFTTKGIGEGTGLGLATVYGIVKQNNGFITIQSTQGQGTSFSIHLPRLEDSSSASPTVEAPICLQRGQETILLVEDDSAILKISAVMLEKQGYRVHSAMSPSEAITIAGEREGEIDLLITDVIMPEMNGRDLATALLSLYPHIRCLYMSGYTADVIGQHGVLDDGEHFIHKPFSLPGFSTKVREVLDGKNLPSRVGETKVNQVK
jgi:CheY-like chemotaxis protein